MLRTLRLRTLVVGLGFFSLIGASTSHAVTWDGGGGDGNWSTAANWVGDVAPAGGEILQFGGTTNLVTNNDFTVDTTFGGINFLAGAGSFTLGGNGIVLGGDINNNSGAAQTITFTPIPVTPTNFTYDGSGLVLDGATSNVNISAGGSLGLGQVTFGLAPKSANVSTLNVNNSASATGLTVQTDSAGINTINIAAGQTFTIDGDVILGNPATASGDGQILTNVTFAGGGNLNVSDGDFYVGIGTLNLGGGDRNVARVDMTGLANFSYTGGGDFGVGWMTRPDGQLRLTPGTNTIVADELRVGTSGRTGTTSSNNNSGETARLFLGAGTNILHADTLVVGSVKGNGVIEWQDPLNGSVTIAAQDGVGRADITVHDQTSATGESANSELLLAGHQANVLADTVIVGRVAGNSGGAGGGSLTFDNGTFDANSLQIGANNGGTSAAGALGTFTMGGGTLIVNNEFLLGNDTNANATGKTSGTFTMDGGTATINAPIARVSTGGAHVDDASVLNLNGGTLNMTGHDIGSAGTPLTMVNLNGGNLTNAARIAGNMINLGAAVNITGTPTYVLPDLGTLTSGLATLNLVSGGGIEGGGASGGSVTGNVVAGSGSHIGVGLDSTLLFNNDLSVNGGSQLDVTANTNPLQPSINVSGSLTTSGGSGSIPINVSGTFTASTSYTLVDYVNSIGGSGFGAFALGTLPPRVVANLVNNGGNQSIDLNVTSVDRAKWTGAQSTQWSTATLPAPKNWTLVNAAGQTDYIDGDNPLFDDSATNTNVDVSVADVLPAAVEFNNTTKNYTVTGSKSVISPGTFTKTGTGTVTLAVPATFGGAASLAAGGTLQIGDGGTTGNLTAASLANEGTLRFNHTGDVTFSTPVSGAGNVVHAGTGTTTFSGASTYLGTTDITAGTVKVTGNSTGNSSLGDPAGGAVTVASGATLDVGGSTTANNVNFGAKQFSVAGTGVGGQGVLINSNATVAQQNAFQQVTLTGSATFGGPGRFDIRGGTPALNLAGFTLTKTGANQFTLFGVTVDDGNIVVNEGTFAVETTTSILDNASGTKLTFNDGTRLGFFTTAGETNITRPMEFNGTVTVFNANDDQPSSFGSPVTMKGSATYTWDEPTGGGNMITQAGVISEMGGSRGIEVKFVPPDDPMSAARNSLSLTADNTFTGSVAVSGPGTLNLTPLSGTPYLGNSANVSVDSNSVLGLNYTGTDTIGALLVGGVSLAPGVYATPGAGFIDLPQIAATSTGTLTVTAKILPGDFDNNNRVDASDYVFWRNNEGTFNTLANDPLSGTAVDGDQYAIWRANFGNTIPGSGGGAALPGAVPEPATAALALVAYGLACSLVRRRSSK